MANIKLESLCYFSDVIYNGSWYHNKIIIIIIRIIIKLRIIITIIIINKFNGNSTELDSHIYSTYKHIKYKAIQMRRNVIRHVIRNVIHTKSRPYISR